MRRVAVAHFEKLGGVVVAVESYPSDAIDFRSQLTKLLNANADTILLAAQGEVSGGTIVKQARELGYEGPIYSEVVATGPSALSIAGEAATGLRAVVPNPDLETDVGREFLASFNSRYGGVAPWPWFQGSAYDGVYIAAECLRQTNDDQDADGFRDCLYNLTWSGAIGDDYRFDKNGDVVRISPSSWRFCRSPSGRPQISATARWDRPPHRSPATPPPAPGAGTDYRSHSATHKNTRRRRRNADQSLTAAAPTSFP